MSKNENLYDRRVVDRNLRETLISLADYNKYLKSLPDAEDKANYSAMENLAPRSYLRGVLGALPAPGAADKAK